MPFNSTAYSGGQDFENLRKQIKVDQVPPSTPEQRRDAVISVVTFGTEHGWTSGQTSSAMAQLGLSREDLIAAKDYMEHLRKERERAGMQ